MNYRTTCIVAFFITVASPGLAQETSVDISVATDYVYRGISQTMAGPALQAGASIAYPNGLYLSVWMSNVDYVAEGAPDDGARREIDYVLGYAFEATDRLGVDLAAMRVTTPGTRSGIDYDYDELLVTLMLDERHRFSAAWSDDIFGSGAPAFNLSVATSFALGDTLELDAELGHFDLSKAFGDDYQYGSVGLTGSLGAFEWRLAAHATTDTARELFGSKAGRPRFVLSLTRSLW